jgi:hypothetical protein
MNFHPVTNRLPNQFGKLLRRTDTFPAANLSNPSRKKTGVPFLAVIPEYF